MSADLERLGISTVGDLLRVDPGRLHGAIATRRSRGDVLAWCQMAALLQIDGVTPQWAEVMQRAGVAKMADLRTRDLPWLLETFTTARDEGRVDTVPTAAEACDVLREAAVIELTGALNGTLLDGDDAPVEGATVRVGKEEETSDGRGRFRVVRIQRWGTPALVVSHPGFRPARFALRRVEATTFTGGQVFRLRAAPARRAAAPAVLMEARGDTLPPVGDAQIGLRETTLDALADRDVLAVTEPSADGERVRLVSKLLAYEDGEFWFPYVWVPVRDLEPGAAAGDCYVVRAGALEAIAMTALKLRGWPAMLRAMRQVGPPPAAADDIEAWLAKGADLMRRAGQRKDRF